MVTSHKSLPPVNPFKTNHSIQKAKGFLTVKTATINLATTKETNHRIISNTDQLATCTTGKLIPICNQHN